MLTTVSPGVRTRYEARSRRSTWPLLLGTAVAFLVGWNADVSEISTGQDSDVFAGMYMATRDGLLFGTDVYGGPLTFLKYLYGYDVLLSSTAFAYTVALQLLVAAVFVWAAHAVLQSWPLATLVAATATSIRADARIYDLDGPSPVNVLAFVVCAHAMRSDSPRALRMTVAIGGGILAAIELLAKINVGLLATATIVFTLMVIGQRRRNFTLFVVAFVITGTSLWFLTGQAVGNIDDYLHLTFAVADAYTLEVASGPAVWDQSAMVVLVQGIVAAVLLGGAWFSSRQEPVTTRIGLVLLTCGFLAALSKFGFMVFGHHGFIFFTSVVGAWFAFRWGSHRRVALLAFAVLVGSYYGGYALIPPDDDDSLLTQVPGLNPVNQRPTGLLDTMSPSKARAAIRTQFDLDERILRHVGDRPVQAPPSMVWAYRWNWKPLPVYAYDLAVTPFTDGVNARELRNSDGPQRLVRDRHTGPFLESPASETALLCHFRHLYAGSGWQVLGRAHDRCETRRFLRRISVRVGQPVQVPALPNAIVLARITGVEPSAFRTAATPFVANPLPQFALDGSARRFSTSTAREGLVVAVPRRFDYPGEFRLARDIESLSILDVGGGGKAESLSIAFHAIPVDPAWSTEAR